jgi:hypothetical protein
MLAELFDVLAERLTKLVRKLEMVDAERVLGGHGWVR